MALAQQMGDTFVPSGSDPELAWFLVVKNRLVSPLLRVAAALAVVVSTIACGGSSTDDPDAGSTPSNARLVILNESDILGLGFGERRTLRVRYETDEGEPIPETVIEFALITAGTERTGGTGLSATDAETDELGVARVDLVAGAENVSFRVSVDAPDALGATFYIAVSDMGFANLVISPVHSGWRVPADDFANVQVRLYRATSAVCADIDIDDPPESLFPPRSMAAFGTDASYQNISAGEGYTVVSWTEGPDNSTPLSFGCVDLDSPQVPPARVSFDVVVVDRDLYLPASTTLSSLFDMQPVVDAIDATGVNAAWDILGCQAGPGQLLLDCTLDALAPDDALDCIVNGDSAITTATEASRGAPDAAGCRPSVYGNMIPSLDQVLTDAVVAGDAWPVGPDLAEVLSTRHEITQGFELHTTLTLWDQAARHELSSIRISGGGDDYTIDFADTAFPQLSDDQVGLSGSDPTQLALTSHGFTLRYGYLSQWAFADLALAPKGLDDDALGTALASSATNGGSGATDCIAVSELTCGEIGQAASCLEVACQQGVIALDGLLTLWWQAMNGVGLDLTLSGSAPIYDFDGDLTVDSIGADEKGKRTGAWQVRFTTATGTGIDTTGGFGTAGVIE
jgi:hypothetical protein